MYVLPPAASHCSCPFHSKAWNSWSSGTLGWAIQGHNCALTLWPPCWAGRHVHNLSQPSFLSIVEDVLPTSWNGQSLGKASRFRDGEQKWPLEVHTQGRFFCVAFSIYSFFHILVLPFPYLSVASCIREMERRHWAGKVGIAFRFHIYNQGLSILPYILVLPVLLFRSPSFCCLFQTHCSPPAISEDQHLPVHFTFHFFHLLHSLFIYSTLFSSTLHPILIWLHPYSFCLPLFLSYLF